jgi:hypothetical protein
MDKKKESAICCNSRYGPDFNDMTVSDGCNANSHSYTYFFGRRYANDTGFGGRSPNSTFFTGSENFQVKENEVFEITD